MAACDGDGNGGQVNEQAAQIMLEFNHIYIAPADISRAPTLAQADFKETRFPELGCKFNQAKRRKWPHGEELKSVALARELMSS